MAAVHKTMTPAKSRRPASIAPVQVSAHPSRTTYRHGDLRRALLDAALDLARAGGPEAVALREATRRVGVVPNAAYRHFDGHADLLAAVRAGALSLAARAMETELARVPGLQSRPATAQRIAHARARLRAVGTGYIRFALKEPGLFRVAFMQPGRLSAPASAEAAGSSGLSPFQLLGAALDELADAGVLPSGRRRDAEFLAWSAVHGLALLALDGPLHGAPKRRVVQLGDALLDMVERGL